MLTQAGEEKRGEKPPLFPCHVSGGLCVKERQGPTTSSYSQAWVPRLMDTVWTMGKRVVVTGEVGDIHPFLQVPLLTEREVMLGDYQS